MWKYDEQDFSIRFLCEKYNTESNTARYLIPRRDLVSFLLNFFAVSLYSFYWFPLSARNLIFFMLMSTESVLIYRFYKIYSPLEYTGHSFMKEELKNFSSTKDVNNSLTTIIYIICYVLSGLFLVL